MIHSYFRRVRDKLKEISPLIKSENVTLDVVSADMGILKGRIVLLDGSILDFREIVSAAEHDYRFHWMDEANKLIIRWDTAPHHRQLSNFPFHKHTGKEVYNSEELDFIGALEYIKKDLIIRLHNKFV
ncbi:MAG: hypothetical protein HY279_10110 [Nitrospinae bacterium]|nr:hypothetical protein [Nitrospinota bacterium]